MSLIIKDRVKETSTSTGTGAMTLAGAPTGFRAFSAVCAVADTAYYCIQAVDASSIPTAEWEVGLGTYSAANTLTRTTVLASSDAGAAVSFSAGTKQVWIDLAAAQIIPTNILTPTDGQLLKYDAATGKWKNGAAPTPTIDTTVSGLYWRIYVTAAQSGGSIFIGEATLRTTALGAQAATGGTAFGSHNINGFAPAAAFDGSTAFNNGYFANSLPANVGYQFLSTTALVEVVIANSPGAGTSGLGSSPMDFLIQASPDGSAWTTVKTVTGENWTDYNQSKTYTLPVVPLPISMSVLPGTNITSPVDGQLLKYDAATGKWKNSSAYVGCRAYNVGTQSIPDNASTAITLNTNDWDTNSIHSVSTNTSRFTVPAGMGGRWRLNYRIGCANNGGTGPRYLFLRKNGGGTDANNILGSNVAATASTTTLLSLSGNITTTLAAGDFVEMFLYQASGSALVVGVASQADMSTANTFEAQFLG